MLISLINNLVEVLSRTEVLEKAIYLIGIFLSAYLFYKLGVRAYKRQKNYEEVKNHYLKNGLEVLQQVVSSCIETIYYNYEILLRELKYIRDFEPEPVISFDDIKISLKKYVPPGFAFGSIFSVEYLLDDDIFKQRILTFFGWFRGTLILFDEINLMIKKIIENPKENIPNEEKQLEFYKDLKSSIEEKLEEVSKHFFIQNLITNLINIIRDKYYFYTSLKSLKRKLKNNPEVQKILSIALWHPVIRDMKDVGVSITEFLGIYSDERNYQESKMGRWERFSVLINKGYVIPCPYEESTGPPEQKDSAIKWNTYLSSKYGVTYSEAYKLSKINEAELEDIEKILSE